MGLKKLSLIVFSAILVMANARKLVKESDLAFKAEKPIVHISSFANEYNTDGSYKFGYESEDGSKRYEQGYFRDSPDSEDGKIKIVEGSYSYIDTNGEVVNMQYVADENGFQPQGSLIPQPIASYLQNLHAIAKLAKNQAVRRA